jgi:hypothetical protein
MSDAAPLDDIPDEFETRVIAQLAVYSTKKDGKGKPKETKSTKTKELDFTFTKENRIEFLRTILGKHSQDKYRITQRKAFAFKYLYPPSKACVTIISKSVLADIRNRTANAVDVDTNNDWTDMYSDITKASAKKVKILVDIKIVKRSCRLSVSNCRTMYFQKYDLSLIPA